jgi:hypothetical protein
MYPSLRVQLLLVFVLDASTVLLILEPQAPKRVKYIVERDKK